MTSESVAVIVPTWNERENIVPLLQALQEALHGYDFHVVVVDDNSEDGTAATAESYASGNPCFQVERRSGKLGLAGAVLHGAQAVKGDYLVMMDADLSHDPHVVPHLVSKLQQGYDVAVGSRYISGGATSHWPWHRRLASRLSILVARMLLGIRVQDPTSGFAAYRRRYLTDLPTRFSAPGFKLLVEVLAVWPHLRVAEYPITFTDRVHGKSKYGYVEISRFVKLCIQLYLYRLRRRLLHHRIIKSH